MCYNMICTKPPVVDMLRMGLETGIYHHEYTHSNVLRWRERKRRRRRSLFLIDFFAHHLIHQLILPQILQQILLILLLLLLLLQLLLLPQLLYYYIIIGRYICVYLYVFFTHKHYAGVYTRVRVCETVNGHKSLNDQNA